MQGDASLQLPLRALENAGDGGSNLVGGGIPHRDSLGLALLGGAPKESPRQEDRGRGEASMQDSVRHAGNVGWLGPLERALRLEPLALPPHVLPRLRLLLTPRAGRILGELSM
eukprot:15456931-Alexandrium_andersonii.AAC.1